MKPFLLVSFILAGFWGSGAVAASCTSLGSTNINESQNLDPNLIRKCIADGYDPPKEWIIRGGTGAERQSGANEMGTGGTIHAGLKTAKESMPHYAGEGCSYATSNTKPGGESDSGAKFACNKSGAGGASYGPPSINIFTSFPFPNVLSCLQNLTANIRGGITGSCISGNVNVCGLGAIGGSACAGPNGVRVNGSAAMTGVQSVSVGAGASAPGFPGISSLRNPISVAGNTLLRLPDGTSVAVDAGSVITTTLDNWVQVRDAGGNLLSEYDLNGFSEAAVLDVPSEGIDIDPGIINANNY